MACFIVPAAEAVVVTVAAKVAESKEKAAAVPEVHLEGKTPGMTETVPFSRKLKWLSRLLWGGVFLLAFEHIWHGEVVPWFPFLTAASNPADLTEMLHEMATVGTTMAALVTVVWLGMVFVSGLIEKRANRELPAEN